MPIPVDAKLSPARGGEQAGGNSGHRGNALEVTYRLPSRLRIMLPDSVRAPSATATCSSEIGGLSRCPQRDARRRNTPLRTSSTNIHIRIFSYCSRSAGGLARSTFRPSTAPTLVREPRGEQCSVFRVIDAVPGLLPASESAFQNAFARIHRWIPGSLTLVNRFKAATTSAPPSHPQCRQ